MSVWNSDISKRAALTMIKHLGGGLLAVFLSGWLFVGSIWLFNYHPIILLGLVMWSIFSLWLCLEYHRFWQRAFDEMMLEAKLKLILEKEAK